MSRINNHPHPRRTSDGRFASMSSPISATAASNALITQFRRQNARANAAKLRRQYPLTEAEAAALDEAKREYAAGLVEQFDLSDWYVRYVASCYTPLPDETERASGNRLAAVAFARQIVASL